MSNEKTYPPSHFAKLGSPSCSKWGKSEIEWMAKAYVQALAANGDSWKELTREQVCEILGGELQGHVRWLFTDDYYSHWFDMIRRQISSSDGAFGVGGFWRKP